MSDVANTSPILIVDDDPIVRSLMRATLEVDGYEIIEAEDGVAACELYKARCPELLIADVVMPRMDGFALCRELRSRPESRVLPWLRKVREFLHENACRTVTLQEIAHAAGRHETHVAREFRRCFGTSVTGYLRRLRIQHAARLLADDERGISAIAFDCGFSSHSHLAREFRLFYGTTPSVYRSVSRR